MNPRTDLNLGEVFFYITIIFHMRAVRVRALAGVTVLCSWARQKPGISSGAMSQSALRLRFFISQLLEFIYWTLTIFIFDGVTLQTNRKSNEATPYYPVSQFYLSSGRLREASGEDGKEIRREKWAEKRGRAHQNKVYRLPRAAPIASLSEFFTFTLFGSLCSPIFFSVLAGSVFEHFKL